MIELTEVAASKVQKVLTRRGSGLGIRLGVKTTGCSGFAYVLEYADVVREGDLEFESFGTKVYVDAKSIVYLNGIMIDYKRNGLNEGFEFINKNERDRCGCGLSFRVQI
jgi:iron-sulfur cluster assembly protein